jgi:acetyltransferase
MFDHLRVFTHSQLPVGNRVAIVTNAGGPGVLTTDEVIANCLKLAELEPQTRKKLAEILPTCANKHNPIDILGDAPAERYRAVMQILAADKNVDSLIIILTPQTSTQIKETAKAVIDLKKHTDKPLVASFMGGDLVIDSVRALRRAKIPALAFPEQAARSLAALTKFSLNRSKVSRYFSFSDVNKKAVEKIFAAARLRGQTFFPEVEALEILAAYKFPLPKYCVATSASEAEHLSKKIGTHLAFKIISPDIVHKTDVGGVMLNVEPAQAGKKYSELLKRVKKQVPDARLAGVLIMEMVKASGGTEFILGINKDPNLGSLLMVGLGGTYVEVFKDVAFGFAPISQQYALKMLKRLKAHKILLGTRGRKPLDINS